MATEVVQTLTEDKKGLQKQLGCMNGILQLFDRRYLLGLHRHGAVQHRLTAGPHEKEFRNSSEKAKDKNQKKMMIEKNQASIESSRNSFSSSSSSTTFSSFDCSKRVQTEWQLPYEPTSPQLHQKQPHWSQPPPDIRDVVKVSMTREIRVTTHERARPVMKHIDSPRPFVHLKSTEYDRKDRTLAKVSSTLKEVKEIPRLSYDERESQYSLKSTYIEVPPRLSLDSKQNSNWNTMNEPRSEPGSNKRPSAGVVARLMGLDSLADSVCEVETLKIKPALQQQKGGDLAYKKPSVYGEMEKKLNALEFNASGKDLRALKQILEAMQMTKIGLKNKEQPLDIQKPVQPCLSTVKGTSSPKRRELVKLAMRPAKMATEPKVLTGHHHVNHTAKKKVSVRTSKNMKATGKTPSPRLQNSKNGVEKQRFNGPSADSSRIKKQSNLKTKQPKIKPVNPTQNKEQSFMYIHNSDTGSFKSIINTNLASQSKPEVTRNKQPKENHRVSEDNFTERLIEDKLMVELPKLSVEQPSPVSVLDAFYIEDSLSPITIKSNDLNNDESLHDDQTECNQVGIYNLVINTDVDQNVKVQKRDHKVQQTELLNWIGETQASPYESTNGDHRYIREILLASGFLNDLDSAIRIVQLHPTSSLIKPELFQLLEKSNVKDDDKNTRSKPEEKIRRKMIFDAVNEILLHKLVNWNDKICGRFMKGEKLLEELWSGIDVLQSCSNRCIYDEDDDDDDEVTHIVSADVNKTSEDWDKCCYEVSGVVLDIERLVFKDLINEVVNAEVASLQDRPRRRRRLFST